MSKEKLSKPYKPLLTEKYAPKKMYVFGKDGKLINEKVVNPKEINNLKD